MSSKSGTTDKKFFQNPFVAMQGTAKRGSQVLNAAVRKMQTRRPFTPSDGNRSSVTNIFCQPNRPTTSVLCNTIETIDRQPVASTKSQKSSSQKAKGGDQPEVLKLEPIVTAARPSSLSTKESHVESGTHSLPSSLPPIIVPRSRFSYVNIDAKPRDHSLFSLNNNEEAKSVPGYLIRSESQNSDIFIPVETCEILVHGDRNERSHESAHVSIKLANLLPQLEKLADSGREVSGSSALEVVDELYKILDDSCILGTSFEHRYTILKFLFKLLDFSFPRLTLHVAKTVLGIKVSGKNLTHLCKAIYKVSMDTKNDSEFLQCQILDPFLKALRSMDAIVDSDALLFCMAAMKFLSANEQIVVEFYNLESPSILLHHLSDIVRLIQNHNEKKEFNKILVQLITTMRNMAENEIIRDTFINNGTLPKLLQTLKFCSSDSHVVLPTVRIISKIVEESKGCDAVKTCEDIFSTFTKLFKIHNFHLDIVVRLGYIVGSLVSADCDCALNFYEEQDFLHVLHTTLCDYVHMDIKRKEIGLKTIVYKEKLFDFTEVQWEQDVPDVIVKILKIASGDLSLISSSCVFQICIKMVRILANMCLNSDVGLKMASDKNCIMCFVQIIEAYKVLETLEEGSWVPFLSVLMALNNITYFVSTSSEISSSFTRLAQCVFPLLSDMYDLQVRLEACHIVGNLTRSAEIRTFVLHNKFLPSLVALLEENDREMLYVAYGVIMNILIDNSMRTAFYEANGIIKLLHQLHLCLSRDWKMVSLLCQILWNYCGGSDASLIPLSNIEVQHLIKVLTYSVKSGTVAEDDDDDSMEYDIWSKEFCPVAVKLLEILKANPCMPERLSR